MQTEKQQVYHCRGIVKQLNAYIKADKLLIIWRQSSDSCIKADVKSKAAC